MRLKTEFFKCILIHEVRRFFLFYTINKALHPFAA